MKSVFWVYGLLDSNHKQKNYNREGLEITEDKFPASKINLIHYVNIVKTSLIIHDVSCYLLGCKLNPIKFKVYMLVGQSPKKVWNTS